MKKRNTCVRLGVLGSCVTAMLLLSAATSRGADAATTSKLVLHITVDQLRGDMIPRFAKRFGDDGFRKLLARGVYYADAHYDYSTTFTAVGHATLFTGGGPMEHGIAANDWLDLKTGEQVYCVEDERFTILNKSPKPHDGTSPRQLTSTTIGDEMIVASGGRAKVFSVSIKDRAAILSGGHRGKTFWYDKDTGMFTTSTYYYDSLPGWATQWNQAKHADAYAGTAWTLLHAPETYFFAEHDDRVFERPFKAMGRAFPHPLGESGTKEFFGALRYAPMGDALTVDFVKTLIDAEQIGADETTDLLAVSLSVTDYIGHAYGPDSLEAEDNLLRLDRTIADLLKHVDEKVGLGSTIVVLSSDHGVDLIPEARCADAIEGHAHAATTRDATSDEPSCDAGRHYPEKFIERINAGLMKRLGVTKPLVMTFWDPSLYLDVKSIDELKLDIEAVERAVAEEVVKLPGFNRAFTRTDLLAGKMPKDAVARAVTEAFHPQRSGHVMIVPSPFWFLYDNPEEFAAMHGTPYSYDTFVPVLIAAPGAKASKVHRRISPRSVAPTVAAMLGIVPPSGSTGDILVEVFGESHSRGVPASAAMSAASE